MPPKKKTPYEQEVDHIYDHLKDTIPGTSEYGNAIADLERLVNAQNNKSMPISKDTILTVAAYIGMSLFVVCFEQINVIRSNAWGGIQKLRF